MTVLEERFLSRRPDHQAITPSSLDGLALSPGPLEAPEALFSDDVRWIEEYPEGRFLDSLASIDGVCRHRGGPDLTWTHRWSCAGRSIATVQIPGELLEQDGEAIWLGSKLRMNCTFADVVRLWNALRTHHPAIWLINKLGRMFTPQSFLEECALPALCDATADRETLPHNLADETFGESVALSGATRQYSVRWRQAAAHMSASAFSLRWPLVELSGSVPLNRCLDRIVRRLDHALTNRGVRYHAYPATRAASRRRITVWVCRSDADLARLIMVRLGLIEPSPTAKERILAVRCDMHGPERPQS